MGSRATSAALLKSEERPGRTSTPAVGVEHRARMSRSVYACGMNPAGHPDVMPYDALLVLSFGGPEKPEDVVPFLENVTRGRGIPRERLEQVGEHYFLFGGRSPINDQNRALIAALEHDFADQGIELPVYFGNRNWDPYLADTLATMTADGVPGPRSSPRRRTPSGRRAGSTARTSRRGRADAGRGASRQAAAVLQPPRLPGARRRRVPLRAR